VALALDASSPARIAGTTNPATTAAFSPPANALLFAICEGDTSNTFSVSGGGLTWGTVITRNAGGGNDGSAGVFWAYNTNAQSNITVSSTKTGSFTANALRVLVFTGAETTFGGATNSAQANTTTVTTTRANSWVWAGIIDEQGTTTATAATGCTLHDALTAFGGIAGGTVKTTATTAASGTAVTIGTSGATLPTVIAFEVRESTGGTVAAPVSIATRDRAAKRRVLR
jgi:hypothetical protein